MWSTATNVTHRVHGLCVCAGHTAELCKNGLTNWHAIWALIHVVHRTMYKMGSRSQYIRGHLWGVTIWQWSLLPNYFGHLLSLLLLLEFTQLVILSSVMPSTVDGIWTHANACEGISENAALILDCWPLHTAERFETVCRIISYRDILCSIGSYPSFLPRHIVPSLHEDFCW